MKFREDDEVKVINAPPYLHEGGIVMGSSADGEIVFVRFEAAMPVELLYRPAVIAGALEHIKDGQLQCSFCGKAQSEVRQMIVGPPGHICNECVGICVEIIADVEKRAQQPPVEAKPKRKSRKKPAAPGAQSEERKTI
jgi:hypothetical protein